MRTTTGMSRNPGGSTIRYYIHRSDAGTRHICTDQGDSLCGATVRPDALAVGAAHRPDLDDLMVETTCGTCRRRWAEWIGSEAAIRGTASPSTY